MITCLSGYIYIYIHIYRDFFGKLYKAISLYVAFESLAPLGVAGAAPVAATPDRKAARKAQNRMQSIMRLLDESAEELQAVDIELVAAGADAERSREIAVSRKAIEERVEALEREWEELEAVVG